MSWVARGGRYNNETTNLETQALATAVPRSYLAITDSWPRQGGMSRGSAEQFEGIDVPTEAVDVDVTLLLDELDVGHGFLDYLQLCSTS